MTGIRRVQFEPDDYARVKTFVAQIKALKPNIRRTVLTSDQRDDGEYAGKLAEVAFARAFGGWPVNWAVGFGGDSFDFRLHTGETVDTKAVSVKRNMTHNYAIPIGPRERLADYLVQVLIAPEYQYGVVTGWIARDEFLRVSRDESGWSHRGTVTPRVVSRAQLSVAWPEAFWVTPPDWRQRASQLRQESLPW